MASWTCIRITERQEWSSKRSADDSAKQSHRATFAAYMSIRDTLYTMSAEELNKRIKTADRTVTGTKAEDEPERPKRRAGDQPKERIKDLASEQDRFV